MQAISIKWKKADAAITLLLLLQVLAKALEVWNLILQPLDAPEMQSTAQHPEQENAFICNLQASAQPLLLIRFSLMTYAITGLCEAIVHGAMQFCTLAIGCLVCHNHCADKSLVQFCMDCLLTSCHSNLWSPKC